MVDVSFKYGLVGWGAQCGGVVSARSMHHEFELGEIVIARCGIHECTYVYFFFAALKWYPAYL